MKTVVFRRMARKGVFVCLLLAMFTFFKTAAQEICPEYPRAMDQVFVCYENKSLKIKQNANLHNPVRFKFPEFPSDVTITFDAGDGNGIIPVSPGEIKAVTYSGPGQYTLAWEVQYYSYLPPTPGVRSRFGSSTFQCNVNNEDANYSDFLPHETWGDISGNTYTPPANGAYPPGSPNTLPVTAGGIVHILYANPDHQMRKPFIFVEGFDLGC